MKVQISNCKAKIEISARPIARACCSCQQFMFLQSEWMVLHRRLAQIFFNAITHCISAYFVAAARAHTGPGHEWECQHCLHTHSPTPLSRLLFSLFHLHTLAHNHPFFTHPSIHIRSHFYLLFHFYIFTHSLTLISSLLPFSSICRHSSKPLFLSFFLLYSK